MLPANVQTHATPWIITISVSRTRNIGNRKRAHCERGLSLEESLESQKSLISLESLEDGQILLCFPQSGGSLIALESLNSLESLGDGLF